MVGEPFPGSNSVTLWWFDIAMENDHIQIYEEYPLVI